MLNTTRSRDRRRPAGATSASYTTPALGLADDGTLLRVEVTNSRGSTTSREATLFVETVIVAGLEASITPDALVVNPGVTAQLTLSIQNVGNVPLIDIVVVAPACGSLLGPGSGSL